MHVASKRGSCHHESGIVFHEAATRAFRPDVGQLMPVMENKRIRRAALVLGGAVAAAAGANAGEALAFSAELGPVEPKMSALSGDRWKEMIAADRNLIAPLAPVESGLSGRLRIEPGAQDASADPARLLLQSRLAEVSTSDTLDRAMISGLAGERLREMRYGISVTAQSGSGSEAIEFAFTPRATITASSSGRTTSAGAEIRVGQGISDQSNPSRHAWYVFAGADNQAVTWDPRQREGLDLVELFKPRDALIVGDVQAGVGYHVWGAQVSFAYVRREFSYERATPGMGETKSSENFAAFSMALRR